MATDPLSSLTGDQRNAYSALTALFDQYGLSTLAPKILQFVQNGFGSDTISLMLQQTSEYKQRFAGNEARVKAGLPALSPGDYINTEESYRQILQSNGLPQGFYDSPSDFTNWIAKDVSPTELNSRVAVAKDYLYNAPAETKDALVNYYGLDSGHMLAYILDPTKAEPLVEQRYRTAQIGGAAQQQGYGLTEADAGALAAAGVTSDQARQGFAQIGSYLPQAAQLGDIYGNAYGLGDAEAETFNTAGAGAAAQKRKTLASQERAAFGGSSGVGNTSLSAPSANG